MRRSGRLRIARSPSSTGMGTLRRSAARMLRNVGPGRGMGRRTARASRPLRHMDAMLRRRIGYTSRTLRRLSPHMARLRHMPLSSLLLPATHDVKDPFQIG